MDRSCRAACSPPFFRRTRRLAMKRDRRYRGRRMRPRALAIVGGSSSLTNWGDSYIIFVQPRMTRRWSGIPATFSDEKKSFRGCNDEINPIASRSTNYASTTRARSGGAERIVLQASRAQPHRTEFYIRISLHFMTIHERQNRSNMPLGRYPDTTISCRRRSSSWRRRRPAWPAPPSWRSSPAAPWRPSLVAAPA